MHRPSQLWQQKLNARLLLFTIGNECDTGSLFGAVEPIPGGRLPTTMTAPRPPPHPKLRIPLDKGGFGCPGFGWWTGGLFFLASPHPFASPPLLAKQGCLPLIGPFILQIPPHKGLFGCRGMGTRVELTCWPFAFHNIFITRLTYICCRLQACTFAC